MWLPQHGKFGSRHKHIDESRIAMFNSIVDNKDSKKKKRKKGVVIKIMKRDRDRPSENPAVTKNFRYK